MSFVFVKYRCIDRGGTDRFAKRNVAHHCSTSQQRLLVVRRNDHPFRHSLHNERVRFSRAERRRGERRKTCPSAKE